MNFPVDASGISFDTAYPALNVPEAAELGRERTRGKLAGDARTRRDTEHQRVSGTFRKGEERDGSPERGIRSRRQGEVE